MNPEIKFGMYFEVETNHGSEIVPSDVCGRTAATHVEALLNYLEGKPMDEDELCEVKEGYLARMSAPGYLDCTEWSAFKTEKEAKDFLEEAYGCPNCGHMPCQC